MMKLCRQQSSFSDKFGAELQVKVSFLGKLSKGANQMQVSRL